MKVEALKAEQNKKNTILRMANKDCLPCAYTISNMQSILTSSMLIVIVSGS